MQRIQFLLVFSTFSLISPLLPAHPVLGPAPDYDGWFESNWFGWFTQQEEDWLLHLEHGYLFPVGSPDNVFLFDLNLDCWIWTSSSVYPNIYKYAPQEGWYYYNVGGNPGVRWFFRQLDQLWIPEAAANAPSSDPEAPEGFVRIVSGEFTMGSPTDELGHSYADETEHSVTLTRDYYIQEHEVTNQQATDIFNWALAQGFVQCDGDSVVNLLGTPHVLLDLSKNDSGLLWDGTQLQVQPSLALYPVVRISWYGAQAYCNLLSLKEGLPINVDWDTWEMNLHGEGYRLPTRAEFEYACRAGTQQALYSGDLTIGFELDENLDRIAWYVLNSDKVLHAIKGKLQNAWNLYDMLGNVQEWCWDRYPFYPDASPVVDPVGPSEGTLRINKGGAFYSNATSTRCASVRSHSPANSRADLGFRPVRPIGN